MADAAIRVGVSGALGRLGRAACAALAASSDCTVVAGLVRNAAAARAANVELPLPPDAIVDDIDAFLSRGLDVVVDCSVYPASVDIARSCIDAGVSAVIGATGWSDEELISFRSRCESARIGALFVPNFSIGAALMIRFSAEAARHFDGAEIIEMHHAQKRDQPSGTARLTAHRIAAAIGTCVLPLIHSVRLPGLVAHQSVIFGGPGETLTIRHDALGHTAYAAGIVLAVRRVRALTGLVTGLETLLFEGSAR